MHNIYEKVALINKKLTLPMINTVTIFNNPAISDLEKFYFEHPELYAEIKDEDCEMQEPDKKVIAFLNAFSQSTEKGFYFDDNNQNLFVN